MAEQSETAPAAGTVTKIQAASRRLAPQPVQMVVDNTAKSKVTDADARLMVAASNLLLPEVAAAWGCLAPTVVFLADLKAAHKSPAKGAWVFHLIDEDPNEPGALAYHTEEGDLVDGYILTKTILENGGVPLYSAAHPATPTVASALFHELAEAFIDPLCNAWWQDNAGVFYCAEVCDPVESNNVVVPVLVPGKGAVKVALSDFVYPAWHDAEAGPGTVFNYANTLKQPFQLDAGGYYVKFNPASDQAPQQVFSEGVLPWKQAMKMKSRRIVRRCK